MTQREIAPEGNTIESIGVTSSRGSSDSGASSLGTIASSLRQHEQQQHHEQPTPLGCFFTALTRKKPLDCRTDTSLNRCLGLRDLTGLGVGSTLGLGLYVLAGQVASNKAGPAVVISFALAALASAFSALCYAEFAGRVPRAGSAYAYSYITVGEFVAFVIGWNLILEYVIGASSVARGFSLYLCYVCDIVWKSLGFGNENESGYRMNSTISVAANTTVVANLTVESILPIATNASQSIGEAITSYLAEYFDWPSLVIVTVLTIFILLGVKESTNITSAFTLLNLSIVIVAVLNSLSSLDSHNWKLSKSEVPPGYGEGGFLPYGWSGVLAGSATCFFGFIGFDTIASSAEEAKNPKRNVPLAIILSLSISFLAYMSVAIVQTLLWPYYDQNRVTILPEIFGRLGMPLTYWLVLLGAIAGLSSSQLGGIYPLPRILYSMASDRLIYGSLSHVNSRLKLPVRATIAGSILVAMLACLLDIQDLADMVSIGTLTAYSLVSLAVLILRYEDRSDLVDDSTIMRNHLSFTDIFKTIETTASNSIGANFQQAAGNSEASSELTSSTAPTLTCHAKLALKPSIPIREKGSRAVTAQMSVGFQSWFRKDETKEPSDRIDEKDEQVDKRQKSATGRRKLIDLLIVWRTDELEQNVAPDEESSRQSKKLIATIVVLTILLDILGQVASKLSAHDATNGNPGHLRLPIEPWVPLACTGSICAVALVATMLMLSRLPTSSSIPSDMFQVPLVPLLPTLSILVNTFLMLNLSYLTWIRFTVWMAFGLFIYFTYGIWNSRGYLLHLDGQ